MKAKWPLRVYAIEPVIAQQNVADAFGRNKQSAFDLVGAVPVGPWRALAGIAAERRAAEDEAAIRLNPTMVGFGAGQSTFGWVFYPRLQTSGASTGRLITDLALLLNGRVPDPTGNDQSIEPGQRECTALIEMPNFIPKIEFITVAELVSHQRGGRRAEVGPGESVDTRPQARRGGERPQPSQGRGPVSPRGVSDRRWTASSSSRTSCPPSDWSVRVPFSGDHNDSRIFCSQGLQLRPSLLGWHGKPPGTRRGIDASSSRARTSAFTTPT